VNEGPSPSPHRGRQSAPALDPGDYQTLFNLGATLRRMGREAEARRQGVTTTSPHNT
jgi:hypothetical protein